MARTARLDVPVARVPAERAEVLAWLKQHPGLTASPAAPVRTLTTGFAALDALLGGGYVRGAITALSGAQGRTSVALAALAAATRAGEVAAWVDAPDALDPRSVAATGACVERLLWVRPEGDSHERVRRALKSVDLVLDAGGFAAAVLDLAGLSAAGAAAQARWWVRLDRRLHASHTALIVLDEGDAAGFTAGTRLECVRRSGAGCEIAVRVLRRRGAAPTGCVNLTLFSAVD